MYMFYKWFRLVSLPIIWGVCIFILAQGDFARAEAVPKSADEKTEKPAASAEKTPEVKPSIGNYLAGRFAETQGDTKNGLQYIEEEVKKDPENKKKLGSLYRMYLQAGMIEKALPLAQKLVGTDVVENANEFSPEMLLLLDSTKKQDYAKAQEYLAKLPRTGFNSILLPIFGVWLNFGEGKIKTVVGIRDVAPDPKTELPHATLSAAYINDLAGFTDEARANFEDALKDERLQSLRLVQAAVNFYLRHDQRDQAEAKAKQYIDSHGDSLLVKAVLALPEKGAKPQPLVKTPADGMAETLFVIASMFHGVRAPADEVAILHFALYLRPEFPEARFLLAGTYETMEEYASAIASYEAISKDSIYYSRGKIRALYDESELGPEKLESAVSKLSQMAQENPKDTEALLAKGDILRMRNRFKDAYDAYSEAIARVANPDKTHWFLYFSRGACQERLGKWDDAEADMKKALALSPNEPEVLNYLGYSWLIKRKNLDEAKKMIETAYEARPEDVHIIDSMGFSLYLSGDYASAQEYYQQALERTPDDPTVNDHLGDAYWQLGKKTEARFQWNRALLQEKDETEKRAIQQKLDKGIPLKAARAVTGREKNAIVLPADE